MKSQSRAAPIPRLGSVCDDHELLDRRLDPLVVELSEHLGDFLRRPDLVEPASPLARRLLRRAVGRPDRSDEVRAEGAEHKDRRRREGGCHPLAHCSSLVYVTGFERIGSAGESLSP